uniref:Uncharacterized protein n=1 Tax=Cacopsylla melanoneura TaxID=428564 RepID=A0A8D8YXW0_9HEMI
MPIPGIDVRLYCSPVIQVQHYISYHEMFDWPKALKLTYLTTKHLCLGVFLYTGSSTLPKSINMPLFSITLITPPTLFLLVSLTEANGSIVTTFIFEHIRVVS